MKKAKTSLHEFVLAAMFLAIIIAMTFTPIGYIPLPTGASMTLIQIPVAIGAIVLGPKYGTLFGVAFGMTSLLKNTWTPTLLSFAFSPLVPVYGDTEGTPWALVICFVPRLLSGIVPYFVYRGIQALPFIKKDGNPLACALSGLSAAVINTVGVLGLIYLVLPDAFAAANAISPEVVLGALMGIVTAQSIPEAIAACVLVGAVAPVLVRLKKRMK